MKFSKVLSLLCVCFLVCTLILNPCVTYASILTASGSNALMTLSLDDTDYSTSLLSSLGSVTNTVSYPQYNFIEVIVYNKTSGRYRYLYPAYNIDSGIDFSFSVGSDEYIYLVDFILTDCKPPNGSYLFSLDFSSDFSYDYYSNFFRIEKRTDNAETLVKAVNIPFVSSAGDFYIEPTSIRLGNISDLRYRFSFNPDEVFNMGGLLKINFTPTDQAADYDLSFTSASSDYEDGISSSLSDLSSSVESVEEEISLVTQAIQTLQGAMEPHYDNVLTQLHHITEQLHAFYDQVYNNIHLPELDMLTQIRTAIENIDLQIEVDISEVKTAINNMSTAVQNKLQSTTDQITGGFDNSQQTQQNQQLQDSINAYDEVEEDIFEDVDGFMQEFEYPSFDSMNGSVIKALAFIGGFLQSIFLSMGDFGTIITFSLTMIFVMIIVGYHRIRS